ncbi:MAG TPA: hypothetical protein VKF61_05635 [Candidatus Polarisedimenticolia bacterium]|nr:hypothetical protein [Candidatus Polarisedimenticolia bacterium]
MIYDKVKAGRMLRVVLDVTDGALDIAARPGGEVGLRIPAMEAEKLMRSLAAKGDVDAMYQEYIRLLQAGATFGTALERRHHKSFESELYRLFKIYLEGDERS